MSSHKRRNTNTNQVIIETTLINVRNMDPMAIAFSIVVTTQANESQVLYVVRELKVKKKDIT